MAITKQSKNADDAEALKQALAAPGAVWELTRNGQAEPIMALLATLAPDAVWQLIKNGQAETLKMTMGLFGTLPPTLEASANPARIFLWQSIQESYQCPA
jgi:molybdopterin-guanine dinucleotide biosynthesis protein A